MKQYLTTPNILWVILILVIGIGGYLLFNRPETHPELVKFEQVQKRIDSLENNVEKRDKTILMLEKKSVYNDSLISSLKGKIEIINEKTKKDIAAVDNYTITDIDGFFSKRY